MNKMKDRLKLADDTIVILKFDNTQLDRQLLALKSDFSVLESLLIESGQTLQRLQEMVRKKDIINDNTMDYIIF